jgi:hypothetical protein
MPLESAVNYINHLDSDWPIDSDGLNNADDHMRYIKKALKQTLLGEAGAGWAIPITVYETELNQLRGVATVTSEYNYLAGTSAGNTTDSKAVVLDSAGDLDCTSSIFSFGTLDSFLIDNCELVSYEENVSNLGTTNGAKVLDTDISNVFKIKQNGSISISFAGTLTANKRRSVTLEVEDTRFAFTASGVKWPAGVQPPISNSSTGFDIYMFTTTDGGTTWMGFQVGFNMS